MDTVSLKCPRRNQNCSTPGRGRRGDGVVDRRLIRQRHSARRRTVRRNIEERSLGLGNNGHATAGCERNLSIGGEGGAEEQTRAEQ